MLYRILCSVIFGVIGGGLAMASVMVTKGLLASPLGHGANLTEPYRVFYFSIMPALCALLTAVYSFYRLSSAAPPDGKDK